VRTRGNWSLPLRWRVFALLMTLAGLLIVDAVQGVRTNAQLEAEQQVVSQLRPTEEIPERLVGGLLAQQNSIRAFALTGDERLLRAYERRQNAEGRSIIALREELRGEPDLMVHLEGAAKAAQIWHRRVAEPVIAATRAGRARQATRIIATIDEPLFDDLRDDALTLSRAVDDRLEASQLRAVALGQSLSRRLWVSSALGLLFVLACGLLIRRWLTRPVMELSGQVRRVAGGRLDRRIVGTGPPEFKKLGRDVEVMRRRIRDELEEARRAMEGLEQNAPLVLSLRSELLSEAAELPDGLRLATRFEPAEGVLAGDWMGTIRLDEDRVGVLVVDVSGHGPEAGLRALWLKHLLVPALNLELGPADALHWAVGQVGDTEDWFATCVLFEVDATTGRCLYANAGHPPAMLVSPRGIEQLPPTGPLFSDLPGARWETEEITLARDQTLVVYTDGITEARSASGEEFGEERLAATLTAASGHDVDRIANQVLDAVHTFGAGRLGDDVTLVLANCPRVPSRVGYASARRAEATR
jgi:serine phosphatase RsbU (regulator of sigma subunit)/CHASE3 domain sensor protein